MAITTPHKGWNRRLYVPTAAEGTFGGGSTTLNIVIEPRRNEGNALIEAVLTENDMAMATGYGPATQRIHLGRELPERTINCVASAELLGWVWGFWGGSGSKSGTTNIAHTHGIATTIKGTEIEEHSSGANANAGYDRKLQGVYITEWTLSGGRTGLVNLDFNVRGTGSKAAAGNQTESGMLIPGRASGWFVGQHATVGWLALSAEHDPAAVTFTTASAANTAANVTTGNSWSLFGCVLDTWSVTGRKILVEDTTRCVGQGSSSGLLGSEPAVDHYEMSATLNFKAAEGSGTGTDTWVDALTSGTTADNVEVSLGVELVNDYDLNTSDYAQALVHIPVATPEQNPDISYSDINTVSLNWMVTQSKGADAYPVVRLFTHDAYDNNYGA